MGDQRVPWGGAEGFGWEGVEDLTALSAGELRKRPEALVGEERTVSYRRGILPGRMGVIRAELVRSGAVASAPEERAS